LLIKEFKKKALNYIGAHLMSVEELPFPSCLCRNVCQTMSRNNVLSINLGNWWKKTFWPLLWLRQQSFSIHITAHYQRCKLHALPLLSKSIVSGSSLPEFPRIICLTVSNIHPAHKPTRYATKSYCDSHLLAAVIPTGSRDWLQWILWRGQYRRLHIQWHMTRDVNWKGLERGG
jgi:hypothetical protein